MGQIGLLIGAVAAFSFVFAGLVYRSSEVLLGRWRRSAAEEADSLEQDLQDLLRILPMAEIRRRIEDSVRHDKQMRDMVDFVNDQRRFVAAELAKNPFVLLFVFVLRELGLEVKQRAEEVERFWAALPLFEGVRGAEERGGLTDMLSRLLALVPADEVHELLSRKARNSQSFSTFLLLIKSQQFFDLCNTIQTNRVLQRHAYWAKEAGIEVLFATELLNDLYTYLTCRLSS